MVPEITKVESERVRLYSARSASGIAASFGVLALSAIAFKIYGITDNAFWVKNQIPKPILTILLVNVNWSHSNWRHLHYHLFGLCPRKRSENTKSSNRNSNITSQKTGSASDYDTLTINENSEENSVKSGTRWYQWFKVPMFYQVSLVYTLSRVAINLSQIFMPFYIELYLGFGSGKSR